MDSSSISTSVPNSRQPRDRDRPQQHSRRLKPPHAISTSTVNLRYNERLASKDEKLQDPPSSPEVISSLITSLSVISKPASRHFDGPSYLDPSIGSRGPNPPVPDSPTARLNGSFGVDYGAFSPALGDLQEEHANLDELAACPPIIKTAKPPSGFSSLTAPKSPKSPSGREGSGLKGLLTGRGSNSAVNVSRPSSRGSLASAHESIGNLSIERGATSPGPESHSLKTQRSHDSWGKKAARNSRGLMYMSSKERLRERDLERKRHSGGASPNPNSSSNTVTPRPDPFLAESVINEEPPADSCQQHLDQPAHPPDHGRASPRPIPARDSSLRKTGSGAKRSSKRDSDPGTIHEGTETSQQNDRDRHQRGSDTSRRRNHATTARDEDQDRDRSSLNVRHRTRRNHSFSKPNPEIYSGGHSPAAASSSPMSPALDFDPLEEGAPFPAVAQGRRRDREASADGRLRRRSGRQTPDPLSGYTSEGGSVSVRLKRSSSRLKRLSGAASPTVDRYSSDNNGAAGAAVAAHQSDQPHIAYERPQSADSIDDSVESYLCSPRLSQKIRHPQTGRVISFSEVGDPNGSAVFCCVGMGLTRYITAFYDELALTLKLRLITPDRPGVGDSESYAEGTATPLGWPDDVYAICQSLKITKFSILAHSAGAIYALATALRMPQHIRGRIHLLAPWIPPSQMSVFGASAQTPLPPTNAIPTSQRILRALPTPILKAANSSFMSATSSSITSSLPKQKRAKRERRSVAPSVGKEANQKSGNNSSGGGGGTDNKENHEHQHQHSHLGDNKELPPAPAGAVASLNGSESMDIIRPSSVSPGPDQAMTNAGHATRHRHHRSNSSARRNNGSRMAGHQEYGSHHDDHGILSAATEMASSALADRERQQIYDSRLTHAIWQLATTGANPAVDLLVCLERRHTIGFRYVDITRTVVIHHGSRDTRVPVENVKWLGKTMRRCEVRVLEGEGHGLMASAQVMGGVLMEISREWEEWGRVTGSTKRDGERTRRGTIGQAR